MCTSMAPDLQKVKQHRQCWAKVVQAYVACPTVFEEQANSGTICLPGISVSQDTLEPAELMFVSFSR